MSLTKKITITDIGVGAGPTFAVYYSLDCISFTFLENVTLASVGAYVIITIPDTSLCIRLTSVSNCFNSVTETIPGALFGDFGYDFYQLDFN